MTHTHTLAPDNVCPILIFRDMSHELERQRANNVIVLMLVSISDARTPVKLLHSWFINVKQPVTLAAAASAVKTDLT